MKKWLKRMGALVLIIVGAFLLILAWTETDTAVQKGYKQNDGLRTIKDGWPGTPVDQKDRFMNHEFPFLPSTVDLLKWKLHRVDRCAGRSAQARRQLLVFEGREHPPSSR